jgi:hypothetical protein
MIFEFWFDPDAAAVYEEYLRESDEVRRLLEGFESFEGVERFESTAEPGKFVAIGFFADMSGGPDGGPHRVRPGVPRGHRDVRVDGQHPLAGRPDRSGAAASGIPRPPDSATPTAPA